MGEVILVIVIGSFYAVVLAHKSIKKRKAKTKEIQMNDIVAFDDHLVI